MSKHQNRNAFLAILAHLGWPLLLGAALCSVFYVLVYRGPLNLPAVHRYFASHPVLIIETGLFFVGLAALGLKAVDVLLQYWALNVVRLDEPPAAGQKIDDVGSLIQQLDQQSSSVRQSYLGRRVREVLQAIQRKGSAEGLDEDLKYMSDLDAARQQDSYGLVRIVIWATPMLGFLGTVVGITHALGDLDPQELATNIQKAMEGLLSGLYVAFDTTALALTLSMVLMFIQFLFDRVETQALSLVDTQANEMLVGRFQEVGAGRDPYLASVERMSGRVLQASEDLVRRQAEIWERTIQAADERWGQLVLSAGGQVQSALQGALEHSLQNHAAELAKVERDAGERAARRWEQLQIALSENARIMRGQQEEMVRQAELMAQVVKATGEVLGLEQALNENLRALSGAKNFEDTVMSLSAAIHLLNARLGKSPDVTPHIELKKTATKGRAA
ncbi:MAG TPA: MotA/TolQ/ExbB proton channel family protein [Candidatus Anammoximicrobium sp.]|nr:MotA/TolQ/ExbB proton channel family protein [Candidatus Anammoximicrobium sp.]